MLRIGCNLSRRGCLHVINHWLPTQDPVAITNSLTKECFVWLCHSNQQASSQSFSLAHCLIAHWKIIRQCGILVHEWSSMSSQGARSCCTLWHARSTCSVQQTSLSSCLRFLDGCMQGGKSMFIPRRRKTYDLLQTCKTSDIKIPRFHSTHKPNLKINTKKRSSNKK